MATEPLDALRRWYARGLPSVMATVVRTWSSAPRPAGSVLAVGPDGQMVGSVTAGCVEAAVLEVCREVASSGTPRLVRYGVSDADAAAVGLSCGGTIDVFVESVTPQAFPEFDAAYGEDSPALAVATVIEGNGDDVADGESGHGDLVGRRLVVQADGDVGSLGDPVLDARVAELVRSRPDAATEVAEIEGLRILITRAQRPPRLIVCGASDLGACVAELASYVGYSVTVVDARETFTAAQRFPAGVRVVTDWPHRFLAGEADAGRLDRHTAVAVLTHDAKFDVPLIATALALPQISYVGLLGSRRTREDRLARLRDAGVTDESLTRIKAPIGLDLGGRAPREIALSVVAELVATRHGGSAANRPAAL